LKKADILAEMASRQFSFRSDSSNAGDYYTRNKLRHTVLPALESIYPGFGAKLIAHAHNHEQLLRSPGAPGALLHREATSQIVDAPYSKGSTKDGSKNASSGRFQEKAPKRERTRQFLRAFQPPNALLLLDSRAVATVDTHGSWHHIPAEERAEPVQNLWTVENVAACHKVPVRGYNELISVQRLGKVLLSYEFIRLLRLNGEVVAVVDSKGDAHGIPHRR
jgi:hypothetical protein